ncbi:MAG: protein kinase [Acidobacteria bacterium]|nr:protein kinase [Acidobacteriota bacterium]
MSPERLDEIERLYDAALTRQPHERSTFLNEACGYDQELKRQVESLLAEDCASDNLLEGRASDLLAELTSEHLDAGAQLGPYRIERLLGAGGMGEVYLAHDSRLNRSVAIKVLPEHLIGDAVAQERLRREVLAAAALDHPFICKIFDAGEHRGSLFCVMEYVRGETLFARMGAGRLAVNDALRIAGEIAEAIEEAHANHFVHRDLKPGNIMLTGQGHVKVMDFGLAKRVERDSYAAAADDTPLTASGTITGTPQYMSPEQLKQSEIDHRSDLFSFGIVLAELVNGKHPFQRKSPMETMTAILRDPPDLSASQGSVIPPGLLVVIRRLLAKLPADRYGSITEVRADLANLTGVAELNRMEAPRVVLIGREQECGVIRRLLDAALDGHGSMVLIGGEPGIGKTQLVRAILEEAVGRGCFTVIGHCYEAEGAPPYVPFVEMLEYTARALPRDALRHALGDAAPEVARLMPELRRVFPHIPPAVQLPPEQQRRYLYNAYREFIDRAASMTPFVAVFEDLHWADEPTLYLLQHLVQTLPSMPVLLIGTYRDVELDVNRPFARALETLLREKRAASVTLRRLPLAGTGELLATLSGQTPPSSATQIVFDQTEGNPFFVEEVFRHLSEEGKLFDSEGAWRQGFRAGQLQVPQGVRLVIGRRLERLPREANRILTTAAVIGRSFSLQLLEDLEGAQPDAVLDALEAAERAHLVEAESAGQETLYRFVHELLRQTLARALSLPRRQRLHARVAESIERSYGSQIDAHASVLAHHLYQAGAAVEVDKTVLWLGRAARQATASAAFEDALAHIEDALSLIQGEQTTRAAELQAERATVFRSLGRMPDAITALEQALALFKATGEVSRFAETSLILVEILWWLERLDDARNVCRRGLELLGPVEGPTRMFLLGASAGVAALANDIGAALPMLHELARLPLPPDPKLIARAARFQTHLRFICAHLDGAYQAAGETQRLCESTGDLWGHVDVAWIRAVMAFHAGKLDESVSIARDAIPMSERIGHWGNAFFCEDNIYNHRFAAGDFDCATEAAAMLDQYERLHYIPWSVKFKVDLGNIARIRGRIDEAIAWCARGTIPCRNHWGGYAHAALALTLAQTGDPRVSQVLEDALPYAPRSGQPAPYGRWPTLNLLIEALATAGRSQDAAALYPAAEEMLGLGYLIMWAGAALPRTTAGIAASCAREWARAEGHHRTAIDQADSMLLRVCQPIGRYWYAQMLRARDSTGDRERAHDLLRQAQSQFESLGMPLYTRQTREAMAALSI